MVIHESKLDFGKMITRVIKRILRGYFTVGRGKFRKGFFKIFKVEDFNLQGRRSGSVWALVWMRSFLVVNGEFGRSNAYNLVG